jgi:hypothetical protein
MAWLFFRDALFCPLACQCGIDEKVLVNAPISYKAGPPVTLFVTFW